MIINQKFYGNIVVDGSEIDSVNIFSLPFCECIKVERENIPILIEQLKGFENVQEATPAVIKKISFNHSGVRSRAPQAITEIINSLGNG